MMTVPFSVAWYATYANKTWVHFYMRGHWLVIGLFVILYFFIGKVYEAFKMSYSGIGEMIYSQMLSLFEVDFIMYFVAFLLIRKAPEVLPLLLVYAVQGGMSIIWSVASKTWYYKAFPAQKTIIVWDMRETSEKSFSNYNLEKKFNVVDVVNVEHCINNLGMLDDAEAVFLSGIRSHDRNIITKYCLLHGITAHLIPRIGDLIISAAKREHMFHLLMLKVERFNPTLEYIITKRLMDIVLSLVAILLFSPFMSITAIAIKLEDHGPVLYKQTRLTKDGKEFKILKFRSMRIDAEKEGVARLSTGDNDDRVTKVGRLIRRVRIDEMPQFINILKGEMTLVGPRAERPEIVAEYQKTMPEFALRLQAKAGLTGLAQVYGKYNTTPYDKLLMDLMYIANASIFEDIRIIFATVKILFMPESTEGVTADQITAMDKEHNEYRKD
ncbi:MAG: sugar transferase [Mogibacterium sp.]|nr:sugar transferase [Mogibacterium sp.]